MATVSFEGETHAEIVSKVRRWLASVDDDPSADLSVAEVVDQSAEVTKNALRIIAGAAPGPLAQSDVVKALTEMGYSATEATRKAVVEGLDSVERLTGGSVVHRARAAGVSAAYSMNAAVARALLGSLKRL
ncbi:MAG TPA: hypothetical protein VFW74_13695 [Acidimicrobiia bacterium]|jgi:hypothetical protein|nr:hypothetical protein [Acidimicrobiia bacterium]